MLPVAIGLKRLYRHDIYKKQLASKSSHIRNKTNNEHNFNTSCLVCLI